MQSSGKSEDWFLYKFVTSSNSSHALFTVLFFLFLRNPKVPHKWEVSFPYILSFFASQPSTCRIQDFSQDTCPIKILLNGVEGIECGRKSCLVVKLLFRCHFLINAADKVVAVHSMRKGRVYLYRKLPPTTLASFHSTFTTKRVLIQHYLLSPSLLGLMKSLGRICFCRWNHVCYFIFNPPRSSNTLQHVSSSNQLVYPTPNMVVVPLCFKKKFSSQQRELEKQPLLPIFQYKKHVHTKAQ